MQIRTRRVPFRLLALGCLLLIVGVLLALCNRVGSGPPSRATGVGASSGVDPSDGHRPGGMPAPTLPSALAVALDVALEEEPRAVYPRLTASWSAGSVAVVPDEPSFTIERDYNQRVVLELDNRGNQARRIVAELGRLEHGLLGGFVGPGSTGAPLEVASQGKAQLDLYLFAQDAALRSYRTHVSVKDAVSGELLAVAPVSILVPPPSFKLSARVGRPDPATLALPVTLENEGGTLSDLTVTPGPGLLGRVLVSPTMDHVALGQDGRIEFRVQPRLSASFRALEGVLLLRGAGQEQQLKLRFDLPAGQRVFVARSFSTTSDGAAGGFCTNNPTPAPAWADPTAAAVLTIGTCGRRAPAARRERPSATRTSPVCPWTPAAVSRPAGAWVR